MSEKGTSRRASISFVALTIITIASAGVLIIFGCQISQMSSFRSYCDELVELQERDEADHNESQGRDGSPEDDLFSCEQDPPFDAEQWRNVIEDSTDSFSRLSDKCPQDVAGKITGQPSREVSVDDADFWAFRPLQVVIPPEVSEVRWVRNPIDRFILAKLESAGVHPSPEAESRVLVRRLWFDLIGLPPDAGQLSLFTDPSNESAYEQLVEQLLKNPGFGERWARTWLDLARYADSNGYEEDELRPYAFTYRDFVIAAMNNDLGFDDFVRWQIAGDEIEPANPLAVAATGFLTAAPMNTFLPQESERRDELDDIVSTTGTAMLGLTIGCARCHDHRYDPISTTDYYRMVAVFEDTQRTHSFLVPDAGEAYRQLAAPIERRRKEIKEMRVRSIVEERLADLDFTESQKDLLRQPVDPDNKEQAKLLSLCMRCLMIDPTDLVGRFEPLPEDVQHHQRLVREILEIAETLPQIPPKGLTITGSRISKTHVLEGGDLKRKRQEVGPGFVTVLTKGRPEWSEDTWKAWAPNEERPRTALAYWLTDIQYGAGGLLARVAVNRLWQHHFGHGLVRTPNDFGWQGDRPSHPELLEWLAGQLIDNDWSLKHIHRLIVTSATYRQAAAVSSRQIAADPENKLFGRRQPQRLSAEVLRDSMLQVSGSLNRAMYGPACVPPIPKEAIFHTQKSKTETWPAEESGSKAAARRAIYMLTKRTIPIPMLQLFDAPEGSFACGKRKTTTVPTQALALMNSPFVRNQARKLALRPDLEERVGGAPSDRPWIRQVYLYALSRLPRSDEEILAIRFLHCESQAEEESDPLERRVDFCHALLMSNEFLYVD